MLRALAAVAAVAFALLVVRAARVGIAGDYVDPIGRVTAQDEALYSHSAIEMARGGGWLTPTFMGRLALYKPPLLIWAAGLSARIFGIGRLPLRLPVVMVCSLCAGLVFWWAAEMTSWQAGLWAAMLLVSDRMWHVLASLCMTDGLLVAAFVVAMYCLFRDPWLESRLSLWGYAGAAAAAVLTKGVAGVLPLAILGLYWIVAPRRYRPVFARVCLAGGLAVALAAPWFVYQLAAHRRWFWTEHIQVEILGFGAGAPPQTSGEGHAMFYFLRMAAIDPVLLAVAVSAIPGLWAALRKRSSDAVVLVCWLAVPLAATFVWQYRNVAYLLPAIPAMAILAGAYGPFATGRAAKWMLVFPLAAFAGKAAFPRMPWSISFEPTTQAVAPLLSSYCERGRGNELIVVDVVDDIYAATLPLTQLRYAVVGGGPEAGSYGMPFREMGIAVTTAEFGEIARLEPMYRDRLRQWGIDSSKPIATLIVAPTQQDLAELVRDHPMVDFVMPDRYRAAAGASHEVVGAGGYLLLLAKSALPRAPRAWTCWM